MIRRLRASAWRAFADLDISFGEGVTFLVAENGVGKTSVLEAAAWALYGDNADVDPEAARRKDADRPASAEVEVVLPDERVLLVRRTVEGRRKTLDVEVDGSEFDSAGLEELLLSSFGAAPEYLARVTILPTDLLRKYEDETFQLRRHLCQVYGVDALEAAAKDIKKYLSRLDKETKSVRSELKSQVADEVRVAAELEQARVTLAELEQQRGAIDADLAALNAAAAAQAEAERARATNAARLQQLEALAADVAAAVGLDVTDVDAERLDQILDDADSDLDAQLDGARRELASVHGRLDIVSAALEELNAAGAECPVCRRPLSDEDAEHARDAHMGDAGALSAQATSVQEAIVAFTGRQSEIRRLRRAVAAVPAPLSVPDDVPVGDAIRRVSLPAELAAISEQVGAVRSQVTQLTSALSASQSAKAEQERAVELYRKEAFALATQETLESTVRTLLTTRVEPVAREVTHRWKQIFGDRGSLQLTPDGELNLLRGGFEVPLTEMSAGEKVVALLTARLLIVAASTKATFMWLDEPLEHLDPSNRRMVASLLATASAPLKQVVITTYEEPLARRLSEQVPDVTLTYIRADV